MAMHSTTTQRAFPRELAWAGVRAAIVLVVAVLMGLGRLLPAQTGVPLPVASKTTQMERSAP